MTAKTFKFTGKAYWARVYEGNHDEYGGKEFYKITVDMDEESVAKFLKSGLKLQLKESEETEEESVVTFRRDIHPKTGVDKKGRKWSLGGGPPLVTDEDGEEITDLIGNGSEVEVKVERYPSKIGKYGHRLEAVRVIDLVKYEKPEDDEDEDEEEAPVKKTPQKTEKTETKEVKKVAKKDLPF